MWAARSASSSHLAAISGSGSPRRLPRPSLPSPPPPPPLQFPFFFFSLPFSLFLSLPLSLASSLFRLLSLFSQRNLRYWKTRLDNEFIKMHVAKPSHPAYHSEYLLSFTRELYFGETTRRRRRANFGNAKSTMIEGYGRPVRAQED